MRLLLLISNIILTLASCVYNVDLSGLLAKNFSVTHFQNPLLIVFTTRTNAEAGSGAFQQRGSQVAHFLNNEQFALSVVLTCEKLCTSLAVSFPASISDVAIIHLKRPCKCGVGVTLPSFTTSSVQTMNIWDPVDIFARPHTQKRKKLWLLHSSTFNAIIEHFPGMTPHFLSEVPSKLYIPFHHSNFDNKSVSIRDEIKKICYFGSATEELRVALKNFSIRYSAQLWIPRTPKVISSCESEAAVELGESIAEQMQTCDLAVVWNQCSKRSECKRNKPAQRMLNHMAVGIPIVINSDYHAQNYFLHEYSGIKYTADTVEEVVEKLTKLLAVDKRRELSTIEQRWSKKYDIRNILSFYFSELCCKTELRCDCRPLRAFL